jgi:hypothetical protein
MSLSLRPKSISQISRPTEGETDDNALIGGFIITGTGTKRIILRAIGPSLSISGALANPRLELYNGTNQLIASNDNWQDAPNGQEIVDSSLAPSHNLEAAILTTVTPGNYTAVVRGENDSTGIAWWKFTTWRQGPDSQLANISTRGFVQTDNDVLIGGLILTGQLPRRVITRAIGPSLTLQGALPDPTLEVRDSNGVLLASNDNWRSTQELEIIATTIPPSHDLESAIVQTLPPASYTRDRPRRKQYYWGLLWLKPTHSNRARDHDQEATTDPSTQLAVSAHGCPYLYSLLDALILRSLLWP